MDYTHRLLIRLPCESSEHTKQAAKPNKYLCMHQSRLPRPPVHVAAHMIEWFNLASSGSLGELVRSLLDSVHSIESSTTRASDMNAPHESFVPD